MHGAIKRQHSTQLDAGLCIGLMSQKPRTKNIASQLACMEKHISSSCMQSCVSVWGGYKMELDDDDGTSTYDTCFTNCHPCIIHILTCYIPIQLQTRHSRSKNYFECVQIGPRSQYANNVQCPIRKQQYNVDAWTYVICHLPELQPTQGSWMNRDQAQSITLLMIDTLGAQTVTRQSTRYMLIFSLLLAIYSLRSKL